MSGRRGQQDWGCLTGPACLVPLPPKARVTGIGGKGGREGGKLPLALYILNNGLGQADLPCCYGRGRGGGSVVEHLVCHAEGSKFSPRQHLQFRRTQSDVLGMGFAGEPVPATADKTGPSGQGGGSDPVEGQCLLGGRGCYCSRSGGSLLRNRVEVCVKVCPRTVL